MWVGGLFWLVFERQSRAHKEWVVKTLEIFFDKFQVPPSALTGGKPYPKHLLELLNDKRKGFAGGIDLFLLWKLIIFFLPHFFDVQAKNF